MKKYKLLGIGVLHEGKVLYRIIALKDFSDVKEGDIGGFVESEENLSQYGDCWVYDSGKVYDDAFVRSNATVREGAEVSERAIMCDHSRAMGLSKVKGDAIMTDNSTITGYACVQGRTKVVGGDTIINGGFHSSEVLEEDKSDVEPEPTLAEKLKEKAKKARAEKYEGQSTFDNMAVYMSKAASEGLDRVDFWLDIVCAGTVEIHDKDRSYHLGFADIDSLESEIKESGLRSSLYKCKLTVYWD